MSKRSSKKRKISKRGLLIMNFVVSMLKQAKKEMKDWLKNVKIEAYQRKDQKEALVLQVKVVD